MGVRTIVIRPDGSADPAILSTITEAQRVPSIGTQLTIEAADLVPSRHGPGVVSLTACCLRPYGWVHEHGCPTVKPERLTLWDQPADLGL